MKPKYVNVVRLPDGRLAVLPQRAFYREDRGLAPHHLKMRAQFVYGAILPDIAVGFVRGYHAALSTHSPAYAQLKPYISPHVEYEVAMREEARGDG